MKHLQTVLDYSRKWSGKGINPANDLSVRVEGDLLFIYSNGELIMDFSVRKYVVRPHWLEMAVRLLKLDDSEALYESALGQIRGFVAGSKDEFFGSVLQGMALTKEEWDRMKAQDADFVENLPSGIFEEIEEFVAG